MDSSRLHSSPLFPVRSFDSSERCFDFTFDARAQLVEELLLQGRQRLLGRPPILPRA